MKNLTQLREQIDAVDKQIVELFEQRMQISADVAKYTLVYVENLKGCLHTEAKSHILTEEQSAL